MQEFSKETQTMSPEDRRTAPTFLKGSTTAFSLQEPEMKRHEFKLRKLKAGYHLFALGEQHDAIYDLVHGWVALYRSLDDGTRQIVHFALPGSILGFTPGSMMTYSAEALTPIVVRVISRRNLIALIRRDADFTFRLAWLACRDRTLAYDHLVSLARQPARERVAHLLLELFILNGMHWPARRSEEMHLPLTQQHIGEALGLTGIHVNRVLQDLRSEGVVEFHHKHLCILNPKQLIQISNIDRHLIRSWIQYESTDLLRCFME